MVPPPRMRTIPMRVHKASTIHKAQGITVGSGCVFTKVICGFGGKSSGSDLVAVSRAQELTDVAIWDADNLDNKQMYRIGKSDSNEVKRNFCEQLLDRQAESVPPVMDLIASHDVAEGKTYAGI